VRYLEVEIHANLIICNNLASTHLQLSFATLSNVTHAAAYIFFRSAGLDHPLAALQGRIADTHDSRSSLPMSPLRASLKVGSVAGTAIQEPIVNAVHVISTGNERGRLRGLIPRCI
jgi:hypothetical protein